MLSKVSLVDLIEEVLSREGGLSGISSDVLADELVERNENLDMFGTGTLVQALGSRKGTNIISNSRGYGDLYIIIEGNNMYSKSGKSTTVVIEGIY